MKNKKTYSVCYEVVAPSIKMALKTRGTMYSIREEGPEYQPENQSNKKVGFKKKK